MSSYVFINYDTTSPHIEIHAPNYTTREMLNTITIESNEDLSDYQEVYLIDSSGDRHDLTFNKDSEKIFIGNVKFTNISLGIANLYARMKDDVDNLSNLANVSIEIKESLDTVYAKVRHYNSIVKTSDRSMKVVAKSLPRRC